MNRIISTIISLFILSSLIGQDYNKLLREGTDWDIHHALGTEICMLSGGERLYFEGDTSVNGFDYKVVKFYPIISLVPIPYCPPFVIDTTSGGIFSFFMREDTILRRVYIMDHWNNEEEELLYDFSLKSGDTLHSQYAGQGSVLTVISVGDTTLLNGDTRGIWYLNSGEYYIESIGGSQGLCYPLIEGIGFWNIPLCITDNGEHLWGNECFGLVRVEEYQNGVHLIAYPNPFTTSTTIEYEVYTRSNIQYTVYNSVGEAVAEGEDRNVAPGKHTITPSLHHLPAGLYYAVLRSGEGMGVVKIVKQ